MRIGKKHINKYWLVSHLPITKAAELRWHREMIDQDYQRHLADAKGTVDPNLIERIQNDWQYEAVLNDDEELELFSRRLLRRARHMRLPVPVMWEDGKLTADYEETHFSSKNVLSLEGAHKVRTAIREEEKWRSEKWTRRLPYVTAATGLVGTLIGLVAVFQKWGTH